MLAEKTVLEKFEEVRREYAVEDAFGIPMSVHERYRKALAQMRRQIRDARNGASGKKLGKLLVEQGALDEEKLESALIEQQKRGNGELLGEILTRLGMIQEETLLSALRMQESEN